MNKIQEVKAYARQKLVTEITAHDLSHSMRVMKIAQYIAENTDSDLDIEVVMVAGLTHDIIDKKVAINVDIAINDLKKKLLDIGYSSQQVDHVLEIIQNISYSSGRVPSSLEGKMVQDADRLEAIGAIAIARTFAYGGKLNRLIYAEGDEDSGIAHFHDKLLLLKDKMHTTIGKEIAQSRHAFMEAYLTQFHKEWNLDDLL